MKNKVPQLLFTLFLCASPAWAGDGSHSGSLKISPENLNFGREEIDTASRARLLTLTNKGDTAIGLNAIGITNAVEPGGFGSQFYTSNNCGTMLAAHTSCTIRVRFAPVLASSVNGVSATLAVQDNAGSPPLTIPLSGKGETSPVTLSQDRVEFGNQTIGTASDAQQVTVTNVGHDPIRISSIWWDFGPPKTFALSSDCGSTLAVGASCTIKMRFTPQDAGIVRSFVYITNQNTKNPVQIAMAGNGVAP